MKPEPSATVEEAAAIVGCDPEALKATIDRYNELVAKGVDEDFGKDITKMTAIEPPYYVYEGHPGNMLVLMGGIACDDYCRALDAEGTPVAGLYVAGNNQGGRFGAEYPMTAPASATASPSAWAASPARMPQPSHSAHPSPSAIPVTRDPQKPLSLPGLSADRAVHEEIPLRQKTA